MKKLFLTFTIIFLSSTVNAQAWRGKGDQKIQLGINAWGYGTGITGTYDYGLNKLLSVGGGLNAYFNGYKNHNKDNRVFIFGRLNFHLQEVLDLPSKWDIYPGFDLGVLGKDFGIGAHIGARYYFNDKIGIFTEVGNSGNIGISFNL